MSGQADGELPVRELDTRDIEPLLRATEGMVVVEFYSAGCPICQMIVPLLEEMAKDMRGRVLFCRVNTDTNPDISEKLGITATPTFIFFCHGRPVGAWVGFVSDAAMRNTIEELNRQKEACLRNSTPLVRTPDSHG
jgi:thioredoxin-like negative regulator of GroEL